MLQGRTKCGPCLYVDAAFKNGIVATVSPFPRYTEVQMSTSIHFMQVGGTIDKDYPPNADNHGYAFKIEKPAYGAILARARVTFRWSSHTIMKMDSLDMTDTDRERVAEEIFASRKRRIVVTHGSDTIFRTAKLLTKYHNPNKTVVLVGSALPEKFRDSDADFNLGVAVGVAQLMGPGVYVVLGGEVIPQNMI